MATYTACCTRVPKCSAQEQNFVNSRRIKLLTPNAGPWNHHRSSRIVKSRANAPDPGNALLQVASNVKSTGRVCPLKRSYNMRGLLQDELQRPEVLNLYLSLSQGFRCWKNSCNCPCPMRQLGQSLCWGVPLQS